MSTTEKDELINDIHTNPVEHLKRFAVIATHCHRGLQTKAASDNRLWVHADRLGGMLDELSELIEDLPK